MVNRNRRKRVKQWDVEGRLQDTGKLPTITGFVLTERWDVDDTALYDLEQERRRVLVEFPETGDPKFAVCGGAILTESELADVKSREVDAERRLDALAREDDEESNVILTVPGQRNWTPPRNRSNRWQDQMLEPGFKNSGVPSGSSFNPGARSGRSFQELERARR